MSVIGNGMWGMCGDCEKDTGKSSKLLKFRFDLSYNLNFTDASIIL